MDGVIIIARYALLSVCTYTKLYLPLFWIVMGHMFCIPHSYTIAPLIVRYDTVQYFVFVTTTVLAQAVYRACNTNSEYGVVASSIKLLITCEIPHVTVCPELAVSG